MLILRFRVSTSKNKNADHRVKEPCATMSIQVTCGVFLDCKKHLISLIMKFSPQN